MVPADLPAPPCAPAHLAGRIHGEHVDDAHILQLRLALEHGEAGRAVGLDHLLGQPRRRRRLLVHADEQACGIWVAPDAVMVKPSDPDWEYACWRIKTTLYMTAFTVVHLVGIHWMYSNTLVTCMRECLEPGHPVRELAWPFTFYAISVNHAAIVKLAGMRGALVRLTAFASEAAMAASSLNTI